MIMIVMRYEDRSILMASVYIPGIVNGQILRIDHGPDHRSIHTAMDMGDITEGPLVQRYLLL